ncbi:conserved hypothetical protein [Leishmania infantum JPCM5]|uniref:Uncharacterized protein n=3 Tax=Leishmania donovani species complex TaxID=38574 RepID=A4I9S0_LEIIN|nr:conserved hypothetical protein [Leishmania infantum JPCM5]CAM71573.2 conserved hypothetical protein [Leishmania infantum JPCM5]|eukprot:XP_001468489.2 conserved hypothetical protein [Leishmania infantum JPCM5]
MHSTPPPETDVNGLASARKRPRSPAVADSLGLPLRGLPPHTPPVLLTNADAALSDATAAGWSTVQQRFAAAQWRRGCFYLSLQAPSEPPASSRPRRSAPTGAPGEEEATAIGAAEAKAAVAARYIQPHPWKVLRSIHGGSALRTVFLPRVKGALVPPAAFLPAFLAPPAMVQLETWNTYWEAYSTCCADELEGLSKQLEAPPSTAGYRRVLLTVSAPAFPSLSTPPTIATSSATTASSAHNHLPVLKGGPPLSVFPSWGKDSKVAEPQMHSSLFSLSSPSVLPSRPLPHSHEASVSSCSHSYSYTSHSRSSGDAVSAVKAAHADDCIAALSFLPCVLDDLLYHYAHRFGAVEHLETRESSASAGAPSTATARVIVSVQFTTAEAAGVFLRWADGVSVADIIASYRRDTQASVTLSEGHLSPARSENVVGTLASDGATGLAMEETTKPQGELDCGDAAWWDALEEASRRQRLCLIAKPAPHDPRRITAKLLLGPNVMVSTPLVKSLFTGLFDTTCMEYRAELRAFCIEFANKKECRLALHALQCSLWRVFGVSLIFT